MAKRPETDKQTLSRLRAGWQRGGRANTPAQNDARRTNAQRAGRPGRVCVFCKTPVRGGHLEAHRDHSCGAHGWQWAQRGAPLAAVDPDPLLLLELYKQLTRIPAERRRWARFIPRLEARLRALNFLAD